MGEGLASRGIEPHEMVLGRDLMVRVGDATSAHDLMRVSADTALNILVMMTERDDEERAGAREELLSRQREEMEREQRARAEVVEANNYLLKKRAEDQELQDAEEHRMLEYATQKEKDLLERRDRKSVV